MKVSRFLQWRHQSHGKLVGQLVLATQSNEAKAGDATIFDLWVLRGNLKHIKLVIARSYGIEA